MMHSARHEHDDGEATTLLSSLFSFFFLPTEAMQEEVEALELEFQLGDLSDLVTPGGQFFWRRRQLICPCLPPIAKQTIHLEI